MGRKVLIIGERPDQIDFKAPETPKEVTPDSIRRGLEASCDRLRAAGHDAHILWTTDTDSIARDAREALAERAYDVIVIGAGLRVMPAFAAHFERLMNLLHAGAPRAKFAFNSKPDDSDRAALRAVEGG